VREFITQAKDPVEDDIIEIPIDGRKIPAYRPSDGQLAVLMASIGTGASDIDGVAGPMNFFGSLLDDDGKKYFTDRLLDRKDAFGPEDLVEIMEALVEEWGARPTQSSSGSTVSPPNDGPKSTPVSQPSISSPSLLTGS
jgi:hypothetical protein